MFGFLKKLTHLWSKLFASGQHSVTVPVEIQEFEGTPEEFDNFKKQLYEQHKRGTILRRKRIKFENKLSLRLMRQIAQSL